MAAAFASNSHASPPPNYKLVWSDEFTGVGNQPDATRWSYDLGNNSGWGNQELENYTNDAAHAHVVSDSAATDGQALQIQATYDSSTGYQSARIKTDGLYSVQYGFIEARIRLPYGQGIWPAFWMLGSNIGTVGWPACGEADIMENIGKQSWWSINQGSLHMPGHSGGGALFAQYILKNDTFKDGYHLFQMLWSKDSIAYYVDNVLYETHTASEVAAGTWPFNAPMFFILNVAVGGNFPGNPDTTTTFPQTMLVDYVRVYQAIPPSEQPPTITAQPTNAEAGTGANVTLAVTPSATDGITFQWYKNNVAIGGATNSTLSLSQISGTDDADYYVALTNSAGTTSSTTVHLTVDAAPFVPPDHAFSNLSARAVVKTGANILIGGFIVGGTGAKKLLVRAVGPDLQSRGVNGFLTDPTITLTDLSGNIITSNDDWGTAATSPDVYAAMQSVTTVLADGSKDAALIVTLPAGGYTALVRSKDGSNGVALVEFFDLDPSSAARLTNISARAYVGTGPNILIAGYIVRGSGSQKSLLRALGPALGPRGVAGFLADPTMQLTASDGTALATNDNWVDDATMSDVVQRIPAVPLTTGSADAALIATEPAGGYTALIRGSDGGSGVALVEAYEVPE